MAESIQLSAAGQVNADKIKETLLQEHPAVNALQQRADFEKTRYISYKRAACFQHVYSMQQ
jgi:hypothetical protein